MPPFDHGSRAKLTVRDLPRFPSDTLFDRVARAVCRAECLPRKELYEAWEVARRTRRRLRGGRVVDLACGHGLAAQLMILLDDTSEHALAVDTRIPQSATALTASLVEAWPRLQGRVQFTESPIAGIRGTPTDVMVSLHACGSLTDEVLALATAATAGVAVLPCCHHVTSESTAGLTGWLDGPLAIDVLRAGRLMQAGYSVLTQSIPEAITPKNRLLIGIPPR